MCRLGNDHHVVSAFTCLQHLMFGNLRTATTDFRMGWCIYIIYVYDMSLNYVYMYNIYSYLSEMNYKSCQNRMIAMIYIIWRYISTFKIVLVINRSEYVFAGKTHLLSYTLIQYGIVTLYGYIDLGKHLLTSREWVSVALIWKQFRS